MHTYYCPDCSAWVDKHDAHECVGEAQKAHYKSLLDYYKKEIQPLAETMPFFERIPAEFECSDCGWEHDLCEITYVESEYYDDQYEEFYMPSPKTTLVLCPPHLGKLLKKLDAEGIGYELKAIENEDPYMLSYEVAPEIPGFEGTRKKLEEL
jgi:rubredoxin